MVSIGQSGDQSWDRVKVDVDFAACGGAKHVSEVVACMNSLGDGRPFHWDGDTQSHSHFSDVEWDAMRNEALRELVEALAKPEAAEPEPPTERKIVPCGREMMWEVVQGTNPEVPECLLPSMMWRAVVRRLQTSLDCKINEATSASLRQAVVEESCKRFLATQPKDSTQASCLLIEVVMHLALTIEVKSFVEHATASMIARLIAKQMGDEHGEGGSQ